MDQRRAEILSMRASGEAWPVIASRFEVTEFRAKQLHEQAMDEVNARRIGERHSPENFWWFERFGEPKLSRARNSVREQVRLVRKGLR